MRVQDDRARLYLLSKNLETIGFLKIEIREFEKFYYKRRFSFLSPRIFRHVRIFEGSGILIFRWIISILPCQFCGNSIFKVLEIAIVGHLIICSSFGPFKFSFINHSVMIGFSRIRNCDYGKFCWIIQDPSCHKFADIRTNSYFLNIGMKSVEKIKFSFRRRRLFGGQPTGPWIPLAFDLYGDTGLRPVGWDWPM